MSPAPPALADVLGHDATDKRIDILRRIARRGSISEAARDAGVSYKAAWQALETLSNLAGTPLVDKAVGGSGGGGALLTPAGRRVLEAAALLDRARAEVLSRLAPPTRHERLGAGLAALALRTSMRNQFPCEVAGLKPTHGLVRVALALPGGGLLQARITRESAELLQLRRGLQVLALCKATAVRVARQVDASASLNALAGRVVRASRAASGGEVVLQLDGGVSLVGFADGGHGLKTGDRAMAGVDEAAVVVAVSG